ncbi:MAG TPA: VCBS repeat-containing protein, partial [Gemmataceae bacterium]
LTEGAAWAKPEQLGELRELLRQRFGAAVVLLDIDGDDLPDVFLPGAVAQGGAVRDLLLRNGGGGKFTDVTAEAGLAGGRASLGGCAADFDNDGHTDLLITRAGGVSLFRNTGDGKFEDKTAAAGLDSLTGVFLGCAALDLDQDSDLDLALARYAGDEAGAVAGLKGGEAPGGGLVVLAHVGEAPPAEPGQQRGPLGLRFRPVEGQEALAIQGPVANVTVTDIDDDRDVDLVVWADGRPGAILRNDRLMRFSRAGEAIGSEGQRANGALAMDADHDERPDRFVVLAGAAPRLLLSPDDAAPGAVAFRDGAAVAPPLRQAQAIDLDLDGWTDVAAVAADGRFVFLHNDGRGKLARRSDDLGPPARGAPGDDLLAAAAADLDGDGYPDLLRFSAARGLTAWKNLGNGNHGLRLVLTGVRDPAPDGAMRTNADGIGTWVEAQAGVTWTGMENTTLAAGLGRSRLPLWLGIGAADRAGFVRVRWPDMVPQGEFDVAAGRVVRLRETDRRADSCPVLFAWDGERFAYVTDCLGAGALGELNPDGSVRPPRPEESVKIEPGRLVPRGGQYLVKIAEPMNEVLYLDRVELLAVDHPAEVDVFPDERFAFAGPAPTGELFAFRERIFPVSARDHRGRDVTELLRHRDGRFADGFARRAWLGFAEEHFVELDFGDRLAQIPGDRRLVLVLAGGTVYPYPEALHAAGQAGVAYLPPVLEQLGEDGRWRAVAELGIPAGLPRVMTREVTGLPGGGGGRLRIRTNARVFWDQVFLAPLLESSANPARVRELGPASASLAARGFAQEVLRPGSPFPEYEDARTEPVAVTPWQGRLTRLGDVTPLLTETDDRFVVTGPGDAVTAAFDAGSLPPLPEGWRRSFVLRLNGYCKSVSPYILTGGRVGPLPFRGMTRYPYGPDEHHPDPAYQREWNTRRPGR